MSFALPVRVGRNWGRSVMENVVALRNPPMMFGRYIFGLGVIAVAVFGLVFGTFHPSQPVPKSFPDRTMLAYAANVLLLIAGFALGWRKTVAWAAAALAIYFGLVDLVLMYGRVIIANYTEYGAYSGAAEPLASAAAALIIYAATANIDAARAARLTRGAQIVFGICAILFGGAHFFYMNLTAPLVPKWLPPNQLFWGYATGFFHIAGGIAILTRIQARLAAILLTVMYALFTPLVHIPTILAHPEVAFNWSENAANIVLTGIAWVVADSFTRTRRGQRIETGTE